MARNDYARAPAINRQLRFLTVCVTPFSRATLFDAIQSWMQYIDMESRCCVSSVIDSKLNSQMIHVRRDFTSQVYIRYQRFRRWATEPFSQIDISLII